MQLAGVRVARAAGGGHHSPAAHSPTRARRCAAPPHAISSSSSSSSGPPPPPALFPEPPPPPALFPEPPPPGAPAPCVVQTQRGLNTVRYPVPPNPCPTCGGTGRSTCGSCRGKGRLNFQDAAMLPKGVWPQWCERARWGGGWAGGLGQSCLRPSDPPHRALCSAQVPRLPRQRAMGLRALLGHWRSARAHWLSPAQRAGRAAAAVAPNSRRRWRWQQQGGRLMNPLAWACGGAGAHTHTKRA